MALKEYIITKIKGDVALRKEDGSFVKLNVGDKVLEGDIVVAGNNSDIQIKDVSNGRTSELKANTRAVAGHEGFMLFASTIHPAPDGTAPIHIPQDMLNTPNGKHANNLHKPITPHKETLISNNDAVSFVMLPRVKFGVDHNMQYARDVNETADLAPRATLNPRIHFSYDQSITQEHTIGTEE